MSPRAACRLESLGFTEVYDYAAGKLDWLAAGLPIEGANASLPRAGDIARPDVPTCTLDERLGDVATRVREAGADVCVVVDARGCVLGLLRADRLDGDPDRRVDESMRAGPSTFRPHVPIAEMASFMQEHDLASAPITRSDGTLIGMLFRDDAERTVHELHAQHG